MRRKTKFVYSCIGLFLNSKVVTRHEVSLFKDDLLLGYFQG
jgi:hypothetical protein